VPEISRLDLLDADTARAARLFLASVARNYAVRAAVLFGSRARGGFRPDSDADIAVLLEGPHRLFLATKLELADIAYDVLLETGVHIQPLPLWEEEWEHPETFSNPRLIENIRREGIPL
jgi:predicted nucleotidyltransferase